MPGMTLSASLRIVPQPAVPSILVNDSPASAAAQELLELLTTSFINVAAPSVLALSIADDRSTYRRGLGEMQFGGAREPVLSSAHTFHLLAKYANEHDFSH